MTDSAESKNFSERWPDPLPLPTPRRNHEITQNTCTAKGFLAKRISDIDTEDMHDKVLVVKRRSVICSGDAHDEDRSPSRSATCDSKVACSRCSQQQLHTMWRKLWGFATNASLACNYHPEPRSHVQFDLGGFLRLHFRNARGCELQRRCVYMRRLSASKHERFACAL